VYGLSLDLENGLCGPKWLDLPKQRGSLEEQRIISPDLE
jgi:hypothetical protein